MLGCGRKCCRIMVAGTYFILIWCCNDVLHILAVAHGEQISPFQHLPQFHSCCRCSTSWSIFLAEAHRSRSMLHDKKGECIFNLMLRMSGIPWILPQFLLQWLCMTWTTLVELTIFSATHNTSYLYCIMTSPYWRTTM